MSDLYWLGWRGSIHSLQEAGWRLHMEHYDQYDTDMREYLLNLTHPATKLVGRGRARITNTQLHMLEAKKIVSPTGMVFPMEIFFANEIHIVSWEKGLPNYTEVKMNWDAYMDIAKSQYPEPNQHRVVTSKLFRPIDKSKEIYVPNQDIRTVDTLLDELLHLQEPRQKEIREKLRKEAMREEYKTQTEEVARIIKVA